MSQVYPGGSNTFIPSFESSGKLAVDFSRNPSKFKLMDYVGLVKVEKRVGLYLKHDWDESVRTSSDGAEWLWADGAAADASDSYVEKGFEWLPYATKRFKFEFSLGDQAVSQAAWDIVASHANSAASLAMTLRTKQVLAKLTNTSYMTNYGTATSVGGGLWSAGTSTNPIIKISLETIANLINLKTNGVVEPKDLCLIVNPNTAAKMSQTAEIHDFVKGSPYSLPMIETNLGQFGLPPTLYGLGKVIVENAVRVTTLKKQTTVREYCLPDNYAVIVARPGDIVQPLNTFSTVSLFMAEELNVFTSYQPDNRRTVGRVVEDYAVEVTAPVAGYLVTNLFS
jgi:hypothetical protein